MKRYSWVTILLEMLLLGAGTLVWAQEEIVPLPPSAQQSQVQQAAQQVWSPQQLNNLVAPLALVGAIVMSREEHSAVLERALLIRASRLHAEPPLAVSRP